MKILYLDPVVASSTSANYKYYDGVYEQLIKHNEVYLFKQPFNDYKKLKQHINWEPEVVIFGLGWFNHKYFGKIENIDVPTVCFLFKPQNYLQDKLEFCKVNDINQILTSIPSFGEYEEQTECKTKLFTYGFDPEVFKARQVKRVYDIGFTGATHENKYYPPGAFETQNLRTKISTLLSHKSDISVLWKSSDTGPSRIPDYEEYATTINSSKMWVATQAAFGDITPRYYEVGASNTLLVCQRVPVQYKDIFRDGENCVQFEKDLSDFDEKIDYYLKNDDERCKIAKTAYDEFRRKHTWAVKASALTKIIQEII